MKRFFLSLFWCAVSWLQVSAQQKFVDKLVKPVDGQGTVRVIQDAEITRMVNGTGAGNENSTSLAASGRISQSITENGNSSVGHKPVRKMKANGYRIQVYAGGETPGQPARRRNGWPESEELLQRHGYLYPFPRVRVGFAGWVISERTRRPIRLCTNCVQPSNSMRH